MSTDVETATTDEPRAAQPARRASDCYALIQVQCWKAEDGKLFESRSSAEFHQKSLDDAKAANEMLDRGESVGAALKAVQYPGEIDPVLYRVTKQTKLVISHWQCQDTPGYQPVRFERGLSLWVGGHAGAWSGPYSSSVSIRDLARYAKDERTDFGA